MFYNIIIISTLSLRHNVLSHIFGTVGGSIYYNTHEPAAVAMKKKQDIWARIRAGAIQNTLLVTPSCP